MLTLEGWRKKLSRCHIHEKLLIGSFTFIFVVLVFDCWFQNLPLSGYGIIFITLFFITCTALAICHELSVILSSTTTTETQESPVESHLQKWCFRFMQKKEENIFDRIFQTEISALQYPTRLNEQMRLLLKDIERDYVKPWYGTVSGNPSFLFDCHLVLEEALFKIFAKLQAAHWGFVIKSVLFLYLSHLQEFKRAKRRAKNCDSNNYADVPKSEVSVDKIYRNLHPASQNDRALNHYLTKVIGILLKEFASHEFVSSLAGSVVTSVLARKMLKTLLFNLEDPAWIYIRVLYIVNNEKYSELMRGRSYSLRESTEVDQTDEGGNKYRMKPVLVRKTENIFDRTLGSKVFNSSSSSAPKKDLLSLPIATARSEQNISSVLGNLISSTAAPLLPDNVSLCYQPLNKMWLSPVTELKQEITDSVVNPLLKTITDGLKVDERKGNGFKEKFLQTKNKVLTRSKSSDAMSPDDDFNLASVKRDISVGEELSEGVFLLEDSGKRLVKTKSFDAGSSSDIMGDDKIQGDVSPVYEEPEDFATTIAKLRNVLQQRESTSTLSDKSSQSLESQGTFSKENTFDSGEKSFSVDLGTSPDSQMACDVPSDGRPFINVCIPSTEVHESSGSSYVLYTVQYDGIYVKQTGEEETQLVLQTTVVKRRFQEFINLQTRLEENPAIRSHLKGIKGPSKWLNLPFTGKTDDSTTASRRPILETFLQQLCSKLEIATSPALQEFLAYGSNCVTAFSSRETNSSMQKIDKFLSNKVTGVFNSLKTVLPSFEGSSSNSLAQDAKEVKSSLEQNLLQGFLNFSNKPDDVPELVLDFQIGEASGDALTDSIRHFLSEKSDCIEDALDVLDNSDWHTEAGECHILVTDGCVWRRFKDSVIDDDLEKFDSKAPIVTLMLDILCELLENSDGWVTKEPVVHILKAMASHWEKELKDRLGILDWDRIAGNLVRLLRLSLFSQQNLEPAKLNSTEIASQLHLALLHILPHSLWQLLGADVLKSATKLLLDSVSLSLCNRDVLLRLLDLIVSQLLSCPHLSI